jgi:hypothetical protein
MRKSFRGLIADGDVQRIRLSTKNGLQGYRIVKLEAIPKNPFTANSENALSTDYERLMFRLVVAWLLSKEFGITMPV